MMQYLGEIIPLPEDLFPLLSELIRQRLGLDFPPDKRTLLQDKLYPLLVNERIDSFFDLYYLLKYSSNNTDLWKRVQSTLSVPETYFWREVDQILAAAQVIIPTLLKESPFSKVRIWHAACSTGEEPYTMAIALNEQPETDWGRIEIIGTDFDERSLQVALKGIYGLRSFRALPHPLKKKYFTELQGQRYQLDESILKRVQFRYLNLADDSEMAQMQGFNLIFCRNVFIYFDTTTVTRVAQHFYRALHNPGFLFLGAAESLLRITTDFELKEIQRAFVYIKQEKTIPKAGNV